MAATHKTVSQQTEIEQLPFRAKKVAAYVFIFKCLYTLFTAVLIC